MQQFLWASLALAALLLAPRPGAATFEMFYLDPTRSELRFEFGSISAQLSSTDFAYADLSQQPGTGPVPISGQFIASIEPDTISPSSISIVPGTGEIHAADAYSVSPGVGGTSGSTDAAFGFSFADPAAGISGDAALHDLVFGLTGFLTTTTNSTGGIALRGELGWQLVSGVLEIQTDIGLGGTAFIPLTNSSSGGIFSFTSSYAEISPGVYEMVLPLEVSFGLFPVSGPLSNTGVSLSFQGDIVATNVIPEPGTACLLGLGLAAVAAGRRARRIR